jgi:hypothetical protein
VDLRYALVVNVCAGIGGRRLVWRRAGALDDVVLPSDSSKSKEGFFHFSNFLLNK